MMNDDGERARWTVELNLRTASIKAAAVLGALGGADLLSLGAVAGANPSAPASMAAQLAGGVGIGFTVMAVVILGVAIYTRVMSAKLDAFDRTMSAKMDAFASAMRADMEAHHKAFVGEVRSFQAGVVTTVDTLKDAIPQPASNVIPFPAQNRDFADAN